jgi:C-terminal processing protease CtpA/Prc
MMKNPGQFVNPLGKDTFTNTLDSTYTYPKKIGILTNRGTMSSAESFLLIAKQSKKVTLFGENSGGTLDYANTQYFDIPCDDYSLAIAISRSKRLPENPIDNIGIPPDVKINPLEKDKVQLVQQQLRIKN